MFDNFQWLEMTSKTLRDSLRCYLLDFFSLLAFHFISKFLPFPFHRYPRDNEALDLFLDSENFNNNFPKFLRSCFLVFWLICEDVPFDPIFLFFFLFEIKVFLYQITILVDDLFFFNHFVHFFIVFNFLPITFSKNLIISPNQLHRF